jgi:hypothetical protein
LFFTDKWDPNVFGDVTVEIGTSEWDRGDYYERQRKKGASPYLSSRPIVTNRRINMHPFPTDLHRGCTKVRDLLGLG